MIMTPTSVVMKHYIRFFRIFVPSQYLKVVVEVVEGGSPVLGIDKAFGLRAFFLLIWFVTACVQIVHNARSVRSFTSWLATSLHMCFAATSLGRPIMSMRTLCANGFLQGLSTQ
jgi:hypothetical protein